MFNTWQLLSEKIKANWKLSFFIYAVLSLVSIQATGTDRIPMETIIQRPAVYNAELSPKGDYVAFLIPDKKRDIVGMMTMNLKTGKTNIVKPHGTLDIYNLSWLNNDEVYFQVGKRNIYVQGLHLVHKDKKNARAIWLSNMVTVVDRLRNEDNRLLLWVESGSSIFKGLYKINTGSDFRIVSLGGRTGVLYPKNMKKKYTLPDGHFLHWYADWEGLPRMALLHHQVEDQTRWIVRSGMDQPWRELPFDIEDVDIAGFDFDGNYIFVNVDQGEITPGLYRYNLAEREFGEALFRDLNYDHSINGSLAFSLKERRLVGLHYYRQKPVSWWISDNFINAQAVLDQSLPDGINQIVGFSDDDTIFLAVNFSDRNPGAYFILDMEKHTISKLLDRQPWIDSTKMAATKPVWYAARDGLSLLAYLTLPVAGAKPYPTIVLPHGGPWVRDVWGFDREVQYLASLGYAVLQPNYRGSAGFHSEISLEDKFDFLKMHDDVTDAAKYLIDEGIADPHRLAIMGSDFGGYLAFCGAVFEPDLYRACITNVGIFDWYDLVKSTEYIKGGFAFDYFSEHLGSLQDDETYLRSISPIYRIGDINVPVLVGHGKEDHTAPFRQSRSLFRKLEKQNLPHEKIFIPWEGHGYFSIKNKRKYYAKVEEFLGKHVPLEPGVKESIALDR